jgi:hypothetical protein
MNTPQILLDVVSVRPCDGHVLIVEFENGETRRFDMQLFFERKPFDRLKDSPLFDKVRVENGTVVWPGNLDIAPDTLYESSVALEVQKSALVPKEGRC